MKKARKFVSALLSVLMVTCMFSALSFGASAAETTDKSGTITVSSNVGESAQYQYNASSKQFTVSYLLKTNDYIINQQSIFTYDSSVLSLVKATSLTGYFPVVGVGGTIVNFDIKDHIYSNSSNLGLYDFTKEGVLFTATFDFVDKTNPVDTNVNLHMQILTGSEATNAMDVQATNDITYIKYDEIHNDLFNLTCTGNVTSEEVPTTEPTTVAPTTIEPTEPTTVQPTTVEPTVAPTTVQPTTAQPTTEPTTVPSDGYYVYGDNLKVKLSASGTGKMSATVALQAGTYTFKLDNYGTLLGYNRTFTDYTTGGLTFRNTYSSSSTLIATGGTYTFQVNTATNTLVVKYNSTLPTEYLVGDLNTILSPVAGKTLSIGSTYLEAGTYKFKLSIDNVQFGYGKTVNDSTTGALSFNSKYSSYCTLVATGGTYTFTLNTATNKLTIGFTPSKDEASDDVHVSGDFDLVLNDNGGENNVATGKVTLSEGTYSFKIYSYGVAYTAGVKISDNGTKQLSTSFKSNVTLVATGGTYNFSFDKTTNKLTVELV